MAFAHEWAADHPIRHAISDRESALARVYEIDAAGREGMTAGDVIADVNASGDDMNRKFDVYGDQLVRQARWEIQRAKLELIADFKKLGGADAMAIVERAAVAAERASNALDKLAPELHQALEVANRADRVKLDGPKPDPTAACRQ